jgi:aryl-alcohol dehydrogenase-like predicted oxidoreductase
VTDQPDLTQRSIGAHLVSSIGIGGASWSVGEVVDEERSRKTLEAALDAGITLIDTSYAYTTADAESHNEKLIARVLAERRDRPEVLIATKGDHFRGPNGWGIDGRPETIRRHCEASLSALGVDRIDLYFLHLPDPAIPLTESVGTLDDLRQEGKIELIGVSNITGDQLDEARTVATISAVENRFSPLAQADRALVERCEQDSVAYLAYSPVGGFNKGSSLGRALPESSRVASDRGISLQRILLAWHLRQSSTIIPIVGSTRPQSITDSAAAPTVDLGPLWQIVDDEIAAIA